MPAPAATTSIPTVFPKAALESALRACLLESVQATAEVKGIALPADAPSQCASQVHLDSLEVVSLLCEVEGVVGFDLEDALVRSGGYVSVDDALEHLLPRIHEAWKKQLRVGVKP
jgi:hypothetical protein